MQVEPGKYYRTRDGRKSPKVQKESGSDSFMLETHIDGEKTVWEDGFIKIDKKPCGGDFVAEWIDDPETLTVSRITFKDGSARVYLSNGAELSGVIHIEAEASAGDITRAELVVKVR